jgi:iron complex transport system substrate-binding protein
VTDDRGRALILAASPQRVLTLQPSATEIVCAVGACSRLVATDDFSDYPDEVKRLPKLGGMNMSTEAIIAQRPDLVVTDSGTRADLVQQLEQAGLHVLVTDAKTFDDVYKDIDLVARALDTVDAGARVVDGMRARVQAVTSKTSGVSRRPRVFHELDATDPNRPFAVGPGTFIDQIIALAGGTNALAASPVAYPQVSAEQVVAADPEIITLGDEDFGTSVDDVVARPGWSGIAAVKNRAIVPVDTNQISRPGPRLVDGLEQFAHIIHPELFP